MVDTDRRLDSNRRLVWTEPVPNNPPSSSHHATNVSEVKYEVSPPLATITPLLDTTPKHEHIHGNPHGNTPVSSSPDGAVQSSSAALVGTTNGLNLLGLGKSFVGPAGGFGVGWRLPICQLH